MIFLFIGKLDMFPLMCAADRVWITELTLIHKNIRSVRNSHGHELTDIENDWSECDVKHMFMSPIKTTMSVLKILTYIITSITVCPVRLAAILVIMSVLNFKTNVILQYAQRFLARNHLDRCFYRGVMAVICHKMSVKSQWNFHRENI
jgi:hypothetical protein